LATPESVKQKLQALIDKVNKETGLNDTTVSQAVNSALAVELEEAYGKLFSRVPLEEDKMYAIGYNWFAAVVALAQQMSYINRDLTPEDILAVLGRVEYYPHIFTEQDIEKISLNLNMLLKELAEDVKVETQKPITDGYITEPVHKFPTNFNIQLRGLKEEISFAPIVTQNVIVTHEDIMSWEYNPRYVEIDEDTNLVLKTNWEYDSVENEVERGTLITIHPFTSDLSTVNEVEVVKHGGI
jgi:hypothetical protein